MAARKVGGKAAPRKRAQRATSNVFAMFDQSQIQEFKEAFNMIDQNHDGFIDKEDLHDMLSSMGKNPTEEQLEKNAERSSRSNQFYHVSDYAGRKTQRY